MKRFFTLLCTLAFVLCLFPATAFAAGEGNMESGGGGMKKGTSANSWTPGNAGVRVTVVDAETGTAVSTPIDYSNTVQTGSILHFGKVSKLQYLGGASLSPKSGTAYSCKNPTHPIPTIVSSTGRNNIESIKRYFCSEYACMMIAEDTGVSYEAMLTGKYKLLVEPLAYFTHNGLYYCMTATEAALYDQLSGGTLKRTMGSLTHKNLPLALFLEYSDLGLPAWNGNTTGKQANADIISSLGVGIVRFKDQPSVPEGGLKAPDMEYRVNTDVITSITLRTSENLTPDNPASVTFHILGTSYQVNNIVIPEDDSQVVWVKWHTPSTPQDINITVSVSGATTAKTSFTARIVDLNEKIPPDPLATDTYPSYSSPALPANSQKLTANWGVWSCYWKEKWVWHPDWKWHSNWQWHSSPCDDSCPLDCPVEHGKWVDNGKWVDEGQWVDEGEWKYNYTGYSASISGTMSLMPDDIVPTANGKDMKSGYGVKTTVNAILSTDAPSGHVTNPQTAFSVFPEFQYSNYLRLLQRVSSGRSAKFTFRANEFSTYGRAAHFTPVWFPDNTNYVVYTQVWDAWTPDGMLSVNLNDYITIHGSLFDDWYTNRE
ncbi:MAG: hypothetical protein K2K63_08065 [Acetatifactor sp.]|nr:hypothetical protein [Acetatifactor sp.]